MLDFIVLGIVPGTNITITFGWTVIIWASFMILMIAYYELKRVRKTAQQTMASKDTELVSSTALPA